MNIDMLSLVPLPFISFMHDWYTVQHKVARGEVVEEISLLGNDMTKSMLRSQ